MDNALAWYVFVGLVVFALPIAIAGTAIQMRIARWWELRKYNRRRNAER